MRRAVSNLLRRALGGAAALGLAACSTTTTPVRTASGQPGYAIECIHLGECYAEARRACKGSYETISKRDNQIPESQLPGLNSVTDSHARSRDGIHPAMPSTVPQGGPGIESDAPMPLTEVVVVCQGA